jgi:hypothetical protein
MTGAKSGLDAAFFLDGPEEYVVTAALGSDRDICFASKNGATPSIEIAVAGNNTSLSISVAGSDVTVHSATGAGGAATSTAAQIVAALNADVSAAALWTARLPPGSTGAGVTGALAHSHGANGVAFTGLSLTDSGDHLSFQAASGSQYWDEDLNLTVYDNASPVTSGFTVNYLRGKITFETTKSGHTITATGTRRSELAFEKVFGCFDCKPKITAKDIDTTSCDDAGWESSISGAKTWEIAAGHFFYDGKIPITKLAIAYIWKIYSTLNIVPFAIGKGTIQSMTTVLVNPNEAQKQDITVKGSGELYLE